MIDYVRQYVRGGFWFFSDLCNSKQNWKREKGEKQDHFLLMQKGRGGLFVFRCRIGTIFLSLQLMWFEEKRWKKKEEEKYCEP